MILISNREKYITRTDICTMCGSRGIGSDCSFLTCNQCGQCYHTYCIGVRPSAIMLAKGWRCLDCAVCDHCGRKNDEARLLLCDECDVSYHIYCVDPPLDAVPQGNWKCKICSICRKCGEALTSNKSFEDKSGRLECLQCISKNECSLCRQAYKESETIIKCTECNCWSHFECNPVNHDKTVEFYENASYICTICCNISSQMIKKEDETEQEQLQTSPIAIKEEIPEKLTASSVSSYNDSIATFHYIDGVCVTDNGLTAIKSLTTEVKRKRKVRQTGSPIPANSMEASNGGNQPLQYADDGQHEKLASEKFKDGLIWDPTEPIPEGYSIFKNEEGVNVLRKKRQRNLQKLGIGGFSCRTRTLKRETDESNIMDTQASTLANDKKKKAIKRKQKNKLSEIYPAYLQEAFFGKSLLDCQETGCDFNSSDEPEPLTTIDYKRENDTKQAATAPAPPPPVVMEVENISQISQQLAASSIGIVDGNGQENVKFAGVEFKQAAAAPTFPDNHINLNDIKTVNIGQPTTHNFPQNTNMRSTIVNTQMNCDNANVLIRDLNNRNLQEGCGGGGVVGGGQTQYTNHNFQSNQCDFPTQIVAAANESPAVNMENETHATDATISNNEKIIDKLRRERERLDKMSRDEALGEMATISSVLYANIEHPNLKEIFPNWAERVKQILKRWRALPADKKAPFLQLAKDNRSANRVQRSTHDQKRIIFQQSLHKENNTFALTNNETTAPTNIIQNQTSSSAYSKYEMTNMNFGEQQLNYVDMQNDNAAAQMNTNYGVIGDDISPVFTLASMDSSAIFNDVQNDDPTAQMPTSICNKFAEGLSSVVGADFEKLETDENAGFGDILGGFDDGEDDDILKSLTSRVGNDFNILEFALDAPSGSQSVLNSLNFEEHE